MRRSSSRLLSVNFPQPLTFTREGGHRVITGAGPVNDSAPVPAGLAGTPAWPGATTNITWAVVDVSGGIGRRIITVVDYSFLDTGVDTVTIKTNGAVAALDGASVVLTAVTGAPAAGEFKAETSNAVTATNLGAAINADTSLKKLITAVAASGVVRIFPVDGCLAVNLTTNADAGEMTVTMDTDGQVLRLWSGRENAVSGAGLSATLNGATLGLYAGSTEEARVTENGLEVPAATGGALVNEAASA